MPGARAELCFGNVSVTEQVVAYLRRRLGSGEVLGEEPLDLPPRVLHTKAVWWTLGDAQLRASGVAASDLPGSAHAAEHASIGLLPLFATVRSLGHRRCVDGHARGHRPAVGVRPRRPPRRGRLRGAGLPHGGGVAPRDP
jgi:ATP-dependent helicase YprA (DUF1998 family)